MPTPLSLTPFVIRLATSALTSHRNVVADARAMLRTRAESLTAEAHAQYSPLSRGEIAGLRDVAAMHEAAAAMLDTLAAEGAVKLSPYEARLRCTAHGLIRDQGSREAARAFAEAAARNADRRAETDPDEDHEDEAMWWDEVAAYLIDGPGRKGA